MKRKTSTIFIVILSIGLIFLFLSACSKEDTESGIKTVQSGNMQQRGNFVDANNDGICDNTGRKMLNNKNSRNRPDFVDADNDGICDRTGRKILTKN